MPAHEPATAALPIWSADQGDGTYRNPIIHADYSDPDVIRVGDDFYMVVSSFNCMPGLPVLHSRDLVSWTIVNHVFERLPDPVYDEPAHGKGAWAPSLRFHDGKYWVFFSTPDEGIWMSTASDPAGAWSPLTLVKAAKGWIDPCPLWDEDGQAYLVHAFARSRAGIKSVLQICRMQPDGTALLDDGRRVFDGTAHHPTVEGPKLYKRNGYYYIFAPAGGVTEGWQTVLRSRDIFGPYEDRVVMAQGVTPVNGPHQGGWVETATGEGWFLHFQDRGAYGRIIHLQPLTWHDDWPVIGADRVGDGVGEPVATWRKPEVGQSYPPVEPATSDEFEGDTLGRQWQWHANPRPEWISLTASPGRLRLYARHVAGGGDLWQAPNLLLQKFPAPAFSVTTRLSFSPRCQGEFAGLVVMGEAYACLGLTLSGVRPRLALYRGAHADEPWHEAKGLELVDRAAYLRVTVDEGASCRFSYSLDGLSFTPVGHLLEARAGRWIGAKVGLCCINPSPHPSKGFADVDWLRFAPCEGGAEGGQR